MSREGALLLTMGVAVLVLLLLWWAWSRRTRRDANLHAPVGEAPTDAVTVATFSGFYVSTTRHDEPLERLAVRGLDFRSRVDIEVTTAGVALDLTGKPRVFITTDRIDHVGQSTVTIDRVVERDGLVRIDWHIDDATVVDTYLRPQDASARALADAVNGILPSQTGTPA